MALGSNWGQPLQTGNNRGLLLNIRVSGTLQILNNTRHLRMNESMKRTMPLIAVALAVTLALPAQAAGCYADYKAKQDNPLRLHYGVAQINGACTRANAQRQLNGRLSAQGWTLLNVLSVFGDEGLAQRRDSAGPNYLRF